jgi:23S rRNA pseudouridine1911/1915/1917 synthase
VRAAEVAPAQHGLRLDKALVEFVPEFSRSYLQQLQDAGLVQVNGQVVTKASQKVRAGDRIQLELRPTPQSQAFKPEPVPFQIAFEDEHILVVNKAAGLVVHPAPGNWSGTLLNGLLHHDPVFFQVPRAGIVHRLDKDTSGLMVVARQREVMDRLVQAIAARTVSRQYLALAQGNWTGPAHRSVDAPIGRDPRNRLRMGVVDLSHQAGKTARTDIDLLGAAPQVCFVRCTLHTGRTHQIRVHMSHIGLPLVADVLYGGNAQLGMVRQALHATRLAFAHPVTGAPLVFEAPPPADFAQALQQCGLRYNAPQA